MTPYFTALVPPALQATSPPTWAPSSPGCGGKNRSASSTAFNIDSSVTPASTTIIKLSLSTSSILSSLCMDRTMPSTVGTAPPDNPVPPPLMKTGVFSVLASFKISDISSLLAGFTTTTLSVGLGLTAKAVSSTR
ncbi:hypothetical protein ES705_31728 [subsurface metagenome]